jgi:GTP-binding protein HflX
LRGWPILGWPFFFENRRLCPKQVITPELSRSLTELSLEIKRQIGIIVNRKGEHLLRLTISNAIKWN